MSYTSLQTIKAANRAYATREGRAFWFAPAAISFFATTFPQGQRVHRGCLFITGETYRADDPAFPVRYTVRRALESGRIETIGTFQEHASIEQAERALWALDLSTLGGAA